jgi:hypothetical protein
MRGLLKGTNKFFGGIGKSFRQFGRKAEKGLNQAINFTEGKILPTIEKVAGGVAKYAPALAMVAPEFAPAILAVGAGAKVVQGGAKAGRQLIGTGRKVVGAIRSGDVGTAVREGQNFRRQGETAYQRGAEGVERTQMMINRPQRNPLRG